MNTNITPEEAKRRREAFDAENMMKASVGFRNFPSPRGLGNLSPGVPVAETTAHYEIVNLLRDIRPHLVRALDNCDPIDIPALSALLKRVNEQLPELTDSGEFTEGE